MKSNTQFAADHLVREAKQAAIAAELAKFKAERERLLAGSFDVGTDEYSSQFFALKDRPPAELVYEGRTPEGWSDFDASRTLHRLPNGDWLEMIGGSKSWTRHTYDLAYVLDRARRAAIGGYAIRPELAAIMREIVRVGANRCGIYALWQDLRDGSVVHCYSHEGNSYAAEKCASWIMCLSDDALRLHPEHSELINRAIAMLGEPDALREFPAPLDVTLINITRAIEEAMARASQVAS